MRRIWAVIFRCHTTPTQIGLVKARLPALRTSDLKHQLENPSRNESAFVLTNLGTETRPQSPLWQPFSSPYTRYTTNLLPFTMILFSSVRSLLSLLHFGQTLSHSFQWASLLQSLLQHVDFDIARCISVRYFSTRHASRGIGPSRQAPRKEHIPF